MFSVVLPVHNEEYMLKRSFLSIVKLEPEEVVVILDRCVDASEYVIKVISRKYNVRIKTIKINSKSKWKIHLNYLYDLGIRNSGNDLVLLTQADIALDPKIRDHVSEAKRRIIFFGYIPYMDFSAIATVVQFMMPYKHRSTGLIALNKHMYLKYNLINDANLLFDTQIAIKSRRLNLPTKFVMTKSWNLRPYIRSKLYDVGYVRCLIGESFIKVFASSLVKMQPEVVAGYIMCKRRSSKY